MLVASDSDAGGESAGAETGRGEAAGETAPPGTVAVDPGQQVLLSIPSMRNPLEELPEAAFGNLLVATVRPPSKVERLVERRGLNPRSVGVVPLSNSPVDYDGPLWTSQRVSPTDLTGISIEVSRGTQYLRRGEGWFVFDNIHALLMYGDERRVYRLLDSLRSSMTDRQIRGLYAVVRSTMGEEYERYRSLFDDEIDRTTDA